MTKRIKADVFFELGGGDYDAQTVDGLDGPRLLISGGGDAVRLTVDDCETLGMEAVLEDVREPRTAGQRFWEACVAEGLAMMPWEGLSPLARRRTEGRAAALGIKADSE